MGEISRGIIAEVSSYYSSKIEQFGETPEGVDWNGESSQRLRFKQLCKIIEPDSESFSLNDMGCGYGALLDFLALSYKDYTYYGYDISNKMIEFAAKRYRKNNNAVFSCTNYPEKTSDFSVASGVFNVRQERSDAEWELYIKDCLKSLNEHSTKGFSFNCLTMYSDADKTRDYLYYADPLMLFDYCKNKFSKNVALLHDYNLYEFTILVRKF